MSIAIEPHIEGHSQASPSFNSQQSDGQGNQYLTFMLDDGEYGVDILRVQEIKGWDRVTPLPNAPDYLRGVINLRGAVVPIIDLRCRFNMARIEYSKTTVVIVLKVHHAKGERTMGFVVDAVSDVYSIGNDQLRQPPDLAGEGQNKVVKSLATVDGKMVILLDIDQLLDSNIEISPSSFLQ
jgi:purine-binding chemotaxis protein CheW